MQQIGLPEIHTRIVLVFLEKLELMTENERGEILRTIALINNPMFITNHQ